MNKTEAIIGLGSNLGDPLKILQSAVLEISGSPEISDFESSAYFRTSPVGPPQNEYINSVCRFKTALSAQELHCFLQSLEAKHGGKPEKIVDGPRYLDLDILFFGQEQASGPELVIPHPKWKERLFVLAPLADLTGLPDHLEALKNFTNPNNETVTKLEVFHEKR